MFEKHFDFKNKVVLVTGSSRGIGKAIAEAFVLTGASVVINSHNNLENLHETEKHLKSIAFNDVMSVQADVSDFNAVIALIEAVISRFGKIDVLVNNAAVSHIGLFTDMKPADWSRITSVNLYSVFNCSNVAIPYMVSAKSGVIVNISSIWGVVGASCEAVYSATKGAVNAFTKAISKELAPSNIRANAIACGVIETGMNDFLDEHERNALIEQISLMRFGTPSDVASLTLFLSSPYADFLTGQIITLDGGMI